MSSLTSKVYILNEPGKLLLVKQPISLDINSHEYIAETLYSAISPGTECAAFNGLGPLRSGVAYPRLVGYCNVARIIQTGSNVNGLQIGDLILTFQSHRSHFKASAEEFYLKLDPNADLKKQAVTYLYHLGYHAVLTADASPVDKIAIIGSGALGYTAASICSVQCRQLTLFSNHFLQEDAPAFAEVKSKNKVELDVASSFDIIINTSNTWSDWHLALQLAAKPSIIINLGFPGRGESPPDFNPLDPTFIYAKNIVIKPLCLLDESNFPVVRSRFSLKRNMEYLLQLVNSGKLDAGKLITNEISYDMLEQQYRKYVSGRGRMLSTILRWTS